MPTIKLYTNFHIFIFDRGTITKTHHSIEKISNLSPIFLIHNKCIKIIKIIVPSKQLDHWNLDILFECILITDFNIPLEEKVLFMEIVFFGNMDSTLKNKINEMMQNIALFLELLLLNFSWKCPVNFVFQRVVLIYFSSINICFSKIHLKSGNKGNSVHISSTKLSQFLMEV